MFGFVDYRKAFLVLQTATAGRGYGNKKAPKPRGLQGLLSSVCNRLRPLTLWVPNNNHDVAYADGRQSRSRVLGIVGHGESV